MYAYMYSYWFCIVPYHILIHIQTTRLTITEMPTNIASNDMAITSLFALIVLVASVMNEVLRRRRSDTSSSVKSPMSSIPTNFSLSITYRLKTS